MSSIRKSWCLLALIAGVIAPSVWADSAQWIIEPHYDSMTRLTSDLYKAKKGKKTTIFDRDGHIVIASADSVTGFSEGMALVLDFSGDTGMKLNGILREDKSVVSVADEIYVNEFPFFSEGLLPVYNKSNKVGYMDTNGRIAIPFKYSNPHPFSNGLAAVSKGKGLLNKFTSAVGIDVMGNDKVFYINKLGGELKLSKEIGDIYLGSTFKNSEALVINKARQFCVINPQGRLVRIEPTVTLRFDSRYALTDVDAQDEPAAVAVRPDGPEIYSSGLLRGYRQGATVILPAQFTDAEPFAGGRAIAARFKAYGVLGLVKGNVAVTLRKGTLPASGTDVKSVDLEVVMPKDYASGEIDVEVTDKDNKLVSRISDSDDGTGRHLISLMLPKNECTVSVRAGGVEIWNSKMNGGDNNSGTTAGDDGVLFTFSAKKVKANAKDAASVAITISNRTGETISGAVRMTGASPSVKSVEIPAGGKKVIRAYLSRITKSEVRTVTINVDGHSDSQRITVEPFFNL